MERGMNLNQACVSLVKKLGYKRSTIINMYTNQTVSEKAAKQIIKALTPTRPRHRVYTEFETDEQKEVARLMGNAERKNRILNG